MKGDFSVNKKAAPKDWRTFSRWHKLACKGDPMTAEKRFLALGGKIPKKKNGIRTNKTTKGKV